MLPAVHKAVLLRRRVVVITVLPEVKAVPVPVLEAWASSPEMAVTEAVAEKAAVAVRAARAVPAVKAPQAAMGFPV